MEQTRVFAASIMMFRFAAAHQCGSSVAEKCYDADPDSRCLSQRPGRNNEVQCEATIKVVDKIEEEDGVITLRERERFSNELTVVYSTGEVSVLK